MANCFVFAWIAIVLLFAGRPAPAASKVDSLPQPTGYVNDFAHVVSSADIQQLDNFCGQVEQKLGVQFALVTIDTLDGEPIEQFSLDLARKWGVGTAKDHEGVLLLLAIKDRQSRVEVGRRVEQYVTDGFAGSTLRAMRPDLRASEYGPALLQGARQMAAQIATGKSIPFDAGDGLAPETRERPEREQRSPFPKIIIGLFVFFFLLNLFRRGGGGGYRGGGGFPMGFLLGSLLSSGGRSRDWGGGGFGGGDSGGGGGFGGFGGGDFGGGGASSNW